MMQYPLRHPMNSSTAANDANIYDAATDVHGVAMGWAVSAIVFRDVGDEAKAAECFRKSYNTTFAPFFMWHEGVGADGSSAQGAPNFVTGAGGFLQAVCAGYGGVRFERFGELTLRNPRPLPNSSSLT